MAEPGRSATQKFDRSIVEGSIGPAVWRLAWPTMLQNVMAGLQGIIDHAMVGHFVGYTANAAIGVSWQIIIVVIVVHQLAVQRDGSSGRPIRGRERTRESEPRRLPGVPDGLRAIGVAGGDRVLSDSYAPPVLAATVFKLPPSEGTSDRPAPTVLTRIVRPSGLHAPPRYAPVEACAGSVVDHR